MKINKELMKGSTVILILTLLDRKEMYGYEMTKEIEKALAVCLLLKKGRYIRSYIRLRWSSWLNRTGMRMVAANGNIIASQRVEEGSWRRRSRSGRCFGRR